MSDVVVPRAQNGDQNLHNDLAVSDDSDIGESDDSKLNTSQVVFSRVNSGMRIRFWPRKRIRGSVPQKGRF